MSTQTPGPVEADAAPSAGPGLKPPAPHAGKEPTPGSATAVAAAVCESPGPDKAGAGASFTLPRRTPLPSFDWPALFLPFMLLSAVAASEPPRMIIEFLAVTSS